MNKFYQRTTVGILRYCLLFLFTFCTTLAFSQAKWGFSYVNITKKTTGGTVEPGDVLEIRYSLLLPNTMGKMYKVRYYDNVPTNTTMNTAAADRLRIITNEGLSVYDYSTGVDADAGNYIPGAVSPAYQVRINIGGTGTNAPGSTASNSTAITTGGGNIDFGVMTDFPRVGTSFLFATAFRVTVNAGTLGATITMGGGRFYYSTAASGGVTTFLTVPSFTVLVSQNAALCTTPVGANFASEFGGTFGKAVGLNRSTNLTIPIPTYNYVNNVSASNSVNDGSYAIVNNTSPRSGTNTNARHIPSCGSGAPVNDDCNNRMFTGHWDVIGDHTGQTTGASNAPPNASANSGYMLMVNSDLVTSEAFKQTITGLCGNTTYEFSAWVKNICSTCGIDRNGTATYLPGVLPNLTFVLDNVDRYSTGEIAYGSLWVKKGFTFTTATNQSSITFSIRNNAQGGGGNDWVLDDITVATCQPNLVMKPYGNASVCYGNQVNFSADIESIFNNYTEWRWEKSNDGGTTWINETSGSSAPTGTPGNYIYTIAHPSFLGDSAAHGDIIRLRVATTPGNLNTSTCSFLAQTMVQILVNNCQWVLNSDITQFKAQQINAGVSLRWAAVNETTGLKYQIEKSTDNRNWKKIQLVNAKVIGGDNNYSEIDPGTVYQTTYYRISMVFQDKSKYTHVLAVQPNAGLPTAMAINTVQNPFSGSLPFDLVVPENGDVNVMLFDMYGKPVKQINQKVSRGNNKVKLSETSALSSGNYILMVRYYDQIIQKKVLKVN